MKRIHIIVSIIIIERVVFFILSNIVWSVLESVLALKAFQTLSVSLEQYWTSTDRSVVHVSVEDKHLVVHIVSNHLSVEYNTFSCSLIHVSKVAIGN